MFLPDLSKITHLINIPEEDKLLQAGERIDRVDDTITYFGVDIKTIKLQPYLTFYLRDNRYSWDYHQTWLSARDIRKGTGASFIRFKHCLGRLQGNRAEYKDGRKLKQTGYIQTKIIDGQLYVKDRCSHYEIRDILKDLVDRRPYLPLAQEWLARVDSRNSNKCKFLSQSLW